MASLVKEIKLFKQRTDRVPHPFWVIVRKEVVDFAQSWRYIILVFLLGLTCIGALYTALSNIRGAVGNSNNDLSFVFLKIFTVSDSSGVMYNFVTFVSLLGPLIGLALGFDAVNSERNKGTLSRMMSQPIHRDYVINAKFVAALFVVSVMFFALGFITMGLGLFTIGIPPSPEEFLRIVCFLILSIVYVAFWLNLSIMFSVRFRQPATSALIGIAVWIFFQFFYELVINLIIKAITPSNVTDVSQVLGLGHFAMFLQRISPSYLFQEATQTLLVPDTRVLDPFIQYQPERLVGALQSPLPLGQSLLLIWPQLTALIAATMICFAISYVGFMRQEIRSR